jgi:hypothetical protein
MIGHSVREDSHKDSRVVFKQLVVEQAELPDGFDCEEVVVSVLARLESRLDQSDADVHEVFVVDLRSTLLEED